MPDQLLANIHDAFRSKRPHFIYLCLESGRRLAFYDDGDGLVSLSLERRGFFRWKTWQLLDFRYGFFTGFPRDFSQEDLEHIWQQAIGILQHLDTSNMQIAYEYQILVSWWQEDYQEAFLL